MSAGVMTANVIWKAAKAMCGMVAAYSAFGFRTDARQPGKLSPPMIPPSEVPGASV